MRSDSISFGNHGMSHSILTKVPLEQLEFELVESRNIIEKKTGEKIVFFSYPNGGIEDFNGQIASYLKEYGYVGACTLIHGSNNGSGELFSLRRFCINDGIGSDVFGEFTESLFAVEISDLFRINHNKSLKVGGYS